MRCAFYRPVCKIVILLIVLVISPIYSLSFFPTCINHLKLSLNVFSQYCKELQQAGLTVSVHPDDDFEPESNNKGGAADGGDAAGKVAGAGTDRRRKDGSTGEGGTP